MFLESSSCMMRMKVLQEMYMNSIDKPLKLSRSKKKVLLVDDMPQVRRDLHQLLELTGLFEVVAEAVDSLEAVRQANDLSPDAVVLDLEMPGMDGYETTRLIKTQNPAMRVIILSAYGGADELEQASAAGADGFVIKGDSYEILVNAILGKDESLYSNGSKKGERT
jgi:DNA-binding NarL/FixJ family response regulator